MASPTTVEERKREILRLLKEDNVETVILVGEAGIGKTWTARQISDTAIHDGICYACIWVYKDMEQDRRLSYESIAHQLSVPSTTEEWDDDNDNAEAEETLENLEQKISAKLDEMRSAAREGNTHLLVILDDEGSVINEGKVKYLFPENYQSRLKFLICRRNTDDGEVTKNNREEITVAHREKVELKPLSENESLALLRKMVETKVLELPTFTQLSPAISKKSMGLPSVIILIAGALNHIAQLDSPIWMLENALEEAAGDDESPGDGASSLLHCAYDRLPRGTMTNCFWHCIEFFSLYGGLHYNELITYWIMDGYVGPVNHIEQAYEEGHRVLMKLIDCGMLKIQQDNIVILESVMQSLTDCRHAGYGGTASLGLTSVFHDGIRRRLGKLTQCDGMIKTLCTNKKWEKVSTLLIDGSRFSREVPKVFFGHMKNLEVLGLFDPRLKSLPPYFSQLNKLLVLVLRDCDLLDNIDYISELKTLSVLEISGARSLENIPDKLFEQLSKLKSLNLTGSRITSLPSLSKLSQLSWLILRGCSSLTELPKIDTLKNLEVLDLSGATSFRRFLQKSFTMLHKLQTFDLSGTQIERFPIISNLKELKRLILRGCKRLTRLPKLEPLPSLQVLDLSDAVKVKEINSESLEHNEDLRILDLSGTMILRLPSSIIYLSELHLRHCSGITELPCMDNLTSLKLLDLSHASNLAKVESFNHLGLLRLINLSDTKITNLPSLSNLRSLLQLLLKDCKSLKELPEVEALTKLKELDLSGCERLCKLPRLNALTKLEVFDLSGCTALAAAEYQSFEHMTCLQKLKLSEAKIEGLSVSSGSLCHLVLRKCTNLKSLPSPGSLSKLEVLDLDGASSLTEIGPQFFEYMSQLQNLNLSHTTVKEFSFVAKLINLRQLLLKGSSGLETELPLESLTRLEMLDLSETAVATISSVEKLGSLRKLFLRDCSKLETLPSLELLTYLEVLDLSGTGIGEFPYKILETGHLKHLDLNLKLIEEIDWEKIKQVPEELNFGQFNMSNPAKILIDGKKPSILVNGTKFLQSLKKEKCLDRVLFCVGNAYCQTIPVLLNDAYFEVRQFPWVLDKSIELRGFKSYPTGLEGILSQAEYISLVENGFNRQLSDFGKPKGLWLENCTELENIFCNGADVERGETLEILLVSNLLKMNRLCSEDVKCVNFRNLNRLHLDCCPMLEDVFPSDSQLENLKFLHIKFCDNLKMVFQCEGPVKCELPNLQKLQLLELPELVSIGAILPSLDEVDVRGCPKLEDSIQTISQISKFR